MSKNSAVILGKGDLAYDRVLICLRGAKAQRIGTGLSGEYLVRLNAMEQIEDATAYQLDLGHIPGRYLVTTAEGKDYEVKILSADSSGINIEYKLAIRNAITTIEDFLRALIAGNITEAMKLVKPGSAVAHQLDFTEIPNYETIQIASVHVDNKIAFGVTNVIFTDNGQDARLTITLIQQRGLWMVDDIDMETSEKAEADIQAFLKRYPTARPVPIKVVERVQLKKTEIRYTFGPVIEKNINEGAVGEACAFDLDTAKAFSFPRGFSGSTPWEKGIRWILENAIDFGNCAGRLQLFDMIAVEVEDKMWDSADAVEINSILMKGSSKEFLPTDREEYTITDPCTYAFKTREGGIGLLQILEKRTTYLKIRYKMLQKEIAGVREKDKLQAEELTAEGWKLWGQRKLAEAEGKFKEAIAKNPEADGAYQGLGWAQLNQGKKLNAKDSFEKCVKLNPKNSAALNGLGWILHGQNNIDEAIQWWEKAIEAQPGTTAALNGLTQVYMEKKEYDEAIKYYQMWLKAEPNNKQAKEGLKKARASNRN